jgi:hypothetical protein
MKTLENWMIDSATRRAKRIGQPVVVYDDDFVEYWDAGPMNRTQVRFCSLQDYEDDLEQGCFISETSVLAIVDESGDLI